MTTSIKTRVLDRIDLAILDVLQKNGRISNVNLARQVNLSPSPCLERVKKLEEDGYIEGYGAKLNATKLCRWVVNNDYLTYAESVACGEIGELIGGYKRCCL